MIIEVYSIYDKVAELYNRPFYSQNQLTAERSFKDACSDPQTELYLHPTDYVLYHIGFYNDVTGVIEPLEKHVQISKGSLQKIKKG